MSRVPDWVVWLVLYGYLTLVAAAFAAPVYALYLLITLIT